MLKFRLFYLLLRIFASGEEHTRVQTVSGKITALFKPKSFRNVLFRNDSSGSRKLTAHT